MTDRKTGRETHNDPPVESQRERWETSSEELSANSDTERNF